MKRRRRTVEVMCSSCMITLDVYSDELPVQCPRCDHAVDDPRVRQLNLTELSYWPVKHRSDEES